MLWKAYGDSALELAPYTSEGEPSVQVVAALRDTARAYRALADAAHRRSRRAWTRARTAVGRAERALKTRVAAT